MVMDKPSMSFMQRNPTTYTFVRGGGIKNVMFHLAIDLPTVCLSEVWVAKDSELVKSGLKEPMEDVGNPLHLSLTYGLFPFILTFWGTLF